MALINCPECGKQVSDKAVSCPNCGYPIQSLTKFGMEEYAENEKFEKNNLVENDLESIMLDVIDKYPENEKVKMIKELRERSGLGLAECKKMIDDYFDGKKRSNINSRNKQEVHPISFVDLKAVRCVNCGSINIQLIGQEVRGARDAKVKTTTSMNLNPLKPFTLFNHKEKVVKKEKSGTVYNKWRCSDCGYSFERRAD